MEDIGKNLILVGGVIVLLGVVMMVSGKGLPLGRLPGDIIIKRENFTFYFPLTTGIIISIVLSAVLMFLNKR